MILFKRIGDHDLPLPKQQTKYAAGFDLSSRIGITVFPGQRLKVPTGFAVQIQPGNAGFIWPRSGLAANKGIDVLAGLIDSDYQGELVAILINHGDEPMVIEPGNRIAQLVIQPVMHCGSMEVAGFASVTERGEGGFGSTGAAS